MIPYRERERGDTRRRGPVTNIHEELVEGRNPPG
jgi:hypothetical protein